MAAVTAVLEARSLHRFYHAGDDEIFALRGVSLAVEAGELVAVTGPSGSGKSTLLACLAGLDDPDGGTVLVAGERLSRRPEPERAAIRARSIGMLFQSANLIEHLTVAENVVLAQRLAHCVERAKVTELLAGVGLGARTGAFPSQLSGGEASRAGLAVALANNPAVVLADEPTGELDSATEADVLTLLRIHATAGAAVVVASHSPAVASAADRVIAIDDGRLA